MSYVLGAQLTRDIPLVTQLAFWPDGDGGLVLTWRAPLAPVDGFVVLAGTSIDTLAELARTPAGIRRWPALPGAALMGVACLVSGQPGKAQLLATPGATIPGPEAQPSGAQCPDVAPDHGPETGIQTGSLATPAESPRGMRRCPACGAALAWHDGLLQCERCGRLLLDDERHGLLDLAGLPDGVCACCVPRRPLQRAGGVLICPASAERYVHGAGDLPVRMRDLPYGLCICCDPAAPLIRAGDAIVCLRQPAQRYRPGPAGWEPAGDAPGLLAEPDAIDAALRANSALLGRNGLFIR